MEMIIFLVIALLVLGPKRLPEVGRSLGNGLREFKASLSDANPLRDEDDEDRERERERVSTLRAD
jgi:sec-independent protein translocase protein TatA